MRKQVPMKVYMKRSALMPFLAVESKLSLTDEDLVSVRPMEDRTRPRKGTGMA